MKNWRLVRVLALMFTLETSRAAANEERPAIATDRPSVAASSIVVPSGALQLENGMTVTSSQGQRTFEGPESLLRVGLTTNTEVRLTLPNYVRPSGTDSSSGGTDLVAGVKQQIGRGMKGFDVSLIVSLSLPTGSDAVSTHGYDPSVQLPWSRAVSPKLTVAGMLSLYTPTEKDRRNVTGETTFVLNRQLTARWDGFVEYAAASRKMAASDIFSTSELASRQHVSNKSTRTSALDFRLLLPTRWSARVIHSGCRVLRDSGDSWYQRTRALNCGDKRPADCGSVTGAGLGPRVARSNRAAERRGRRAGLQRTPLTSCIATSRRKTS